jgi:hypothetical protein
MAQVIECLTCRCKDLSSNPNGGKKGGKEEGREEGRR